MDPPFQRRGIASRLTRHSIEWFGNAGMSIVMVETGGDPGHSPARRTDESAGFPAPGREVLQGPVGAPGYASTWESACARNRSATGEGVELGDANDLLEPGYLDLESGYTRLADGQLHVAAWTTMPRCKGAMVEWWFGFLETTEQYKWWHPKDHVWCEWVGERGTGRFIGGAHHVHEYIGGDLQKLKIHFREPSEYLDVARFAEAGVSAAICARVGLLEAPVWAGHLIHLCRDTDYGCEMRSRFWLGDTDPKEVAPDRESRIGLFPDPGGADLLKHCHEEMTYLAGFLPGLHAKHA